MRQMVGGLGALASASIGVVSTSTWLLSGLCSAMSVGFSVQTAHQIGAGDEKEGKKSCKEWSVCRGTLFPDSDGRRKLR